MSPRDPCFLLAKTGEVSLQGNRYPGVSNVSFSRGRINALKWSTCFCSFHTRILNLSSVSAPTRQRNPETTMFEKSKANLHKNSRRRGIRNLRRINRMLNRFVLTYLARHQQYSLRRKTFHTTSSQCSTASGRQFSVTATRIIRIMLQVQRRFLLQPNNNTPVITLPALT